MRLSRTFGLGAALAVLPLVAGLAFTVDRLQDLASQSERLMLRQLTAVRLGTGVATRLDRLGEYQSKFAVAHDDAYADKAQQVARAIDAEVNTLRAADLGTSEDVALAAFIQRWQHYRQTAWAVDDNHDNHDNGDADGSDGDVDSASRRQVAEIEGLAVTARELLTNAHAAAIADVADADDTRAAAWRAAITATGVALLSSVSVLWFVVRRLRQRLDDFVEASVAVSRGAFSAQLPAGGDDELGRVATAFNDMVVALEQLERLKSDFISSISHELRTPLVAMVETNEALLDDVAGPLTERQRRMITLNRGAAQRLSVMLGDLLELSVVRSGLRYRMGSAGLDDVVNNAVSELDARASEHGVSLQVQFEARGLVVHADSDRLMQVVQNLVSNAIKHTPANSRIEVVVREVARADVPHAPRGSDSDLRYAVVRVDDTGPGIPGADRERVFEKFFRRQGVSADGVGLGLAICREIAHAHRGAIWIEDGRLGGASVCVAIPVETTT